MPRSNKSTVAIALYLTIVALFCIGGCIQGMETSTQSFPGNSCNNPGNAPHCNSQVVNDIYKSFDPYNNETEREVHYQRSRFPFRITRTLLQEFGDDARKLFVFRYHDQKELLKQYAQDFGRIKNVIPTITFQPRNAQDVKKLLAIAARDKNFQVVVRGGSGNVSGATQVESNLRILITDSKPQVLIDASARMNNVNEIDTVNKVATVEPGVTWAQLVNEAAANALRPVVIPDYLGITLGGVLSIGGLGGNTYKDGPATKYITELEVVNADGDIITCSPTQNAQLFNAVRGGLGQFAVITKIKMQLIGNKPLTRVYQFLTPYFNKLYTDLNKLIRLQQDPQQSIQFDTVQSFVLANNPQGVETIVANADPALIEPKRDDLIQTLYSRDQVWVYQIECTLRYSENEAQNIPTGEQFAQLLSEDQNKNLTFVLDLPTTAWDNRLLLNTVPALEQAGNWFKRHPWVSIYLSGEAATEVVPDIFNNQFTDPVADTGGAFIGFYCYLEKSFENSGTFLSYPRKLNQQPNNSTICALSIGRDELTDTLQGLLRQVTSNRHIWNQSKSYSTPNEVAASIYHISYIPFFGPNDWKAHFSLPLYNEYLNTKDVLDPNAVFADVKRIQH